MDPPSLLPALWRVLAAIAQRFGEGVGYMQGLNFLAAFLLVSGSTTTIRARVGTKGGHADRKTDRDAKDGAADDGATEHGNGDGIGAHGGPCGLAQDVVVVAGPVVVAAVARTWCDADPPDSDLAATDDSEGREGGNLERSGTEVLLHMREVMLKDAELKQSLGIDRTHVYTHVHTHVYTHVHAPVHTLVHAHVYAHIYTHVYTHVYTSVLHACCMHAACVLHAHCKYVASMLQVYSKDTGM